MKPIIMTIVISTSIAVIAWLILLKVTSDFGYMHEKELTQQQE